MSGCLIVCRSITYAQRAKKVLAHFGIDAQVVRPSPELLENSCGFAVRVSEIYLAEALDILKNNGFAISRVLVYDKSGEPRVMRL